MGQVGFHDADGQTSRMGRHQRQVEGASNDAFIGLRFFGKGRIVEWMFFFANNKIVTKSQPKPSDLKLFRCFFFKRFPGTKKL